MVTVVPEQEEKAVKISAEGRHENKQGQHQQQETATHDLHRSLVVKAVAMMMKAGTSCHLWEFVVLAPKQH